MSHHSFAAVFASHWLKLIIVVLLSVCHWFCSSFFQAVEIVVTPRLFTLLLVVFGSTIAFESIVLFVLIASLLLFPLLL